MWNKTPEEETWKSVPSHPNYEVSNLGLVRRRLVDSSYKPVTLHHQKRRAPYITCYRNGSAASLHMDELMRHLFDIEWVSEDPWHGTIGGYSNHKCRCHACSTAWNRYCADRQKGRRRSDGPDHGKIAMFESGCRCHSCVRADNARKYATHVHNRPSDLYEKLCEIQGERCAICDRPPDEGKRLPIDHDHVTGAIRGLLCHGCNTALGKFKDSLKVLDRAKAYVTKGAVQLELPQDS